MSTDRWLTTAEAAAYLSMTPKAFDEWVRRHGVPCGRTGLRTRRFKASALDKVLATFAARYEGTR